MSATLFYIAIQLLDLMERVTQVFKEDATAVLRNSAISVSNFQNVSVIFQGISPRFSLSTKKILPFYCLGISSSS